MVAEHILFNCETLISNRGRQYRCIIESMPYAMKQNFEEFDNFNKAAFLLSGLRCDFTIEWVSLYKKILIWVHETYAERKKIYENHYD